jgi:hypothetical protein
MLEWGSYFLTFGAYRGFHEVNIARVKWMEGFNISMRNLQLQHSINKPTYSVV